MSTYEMASFVLWAATEVALAVMATVVLGDKGAKLRGHSTLGRRYLVDWAVTWGGSMALLAVLAGALTFRRSTRWKVILTWPWVVGPAISVGWFLALSGQMHPGSQLCRHEADDPCMYSFQIGGAFLAVAAALVIGGLFVAVASLKRLLLRPSAEN